MNTKRKQERKDPTAANVRLPRVVDFTSAHSRLERIVDKSLPDDRKALMTAPKQQQYFG
jgi:hypothetical protein